MINKIDNIKWYSQKKLFTVIMLSVSISGCSIVPDSLNPLEWYRGLGELDYSNNSVFPNLSSVPKRPKVSSKKQIETIAEGLVKDNFVVPKYSDEVMQRQDNKNSLKSNLQKNSLNLSKNEIDLISIEMHGYNEKTKKNAKLIFDIMEKNGFKRVYGNYPDTLIFKKI